MAVRVRATQLVPPLSASQIVTFSEYRRKQNLPQTSCRPEGCITKFHYEIASEMIVDGQKTTDVQGLEAAERPLVGTIPPPFQMGSPHSLSDIPPFRP